MNKKEKIKILLFAPMQDRQSGDYIMNALIKLNYKVASSDFRVAQSKLGNDEMNRWAKFEAERLSPDYIIILKGHEFKKETITELKKIAPVSIWIFDVTLSGIPITESKEYIEVIKEANYFFTIAKGQVEELKKLGVNAHFLREGYDPRNHRKEIVNWYESKKYSADVMFSGSIGTQGFHESRINFLSKILELEAKLKIYGMIHDKNKVPQNLMQSHFGRPVINREHNIAVQATKIILGRCGWPNVEESYSARLYRVIAAGGFYLTNYIKGTENTFKINKRSEGITGNEEFIVYYDDYDCFNKILFFLNPKNENLRQKIAKNGQKRILKDFSFEKSLKEMFKILGDTNGRKK